jgi:hypothetical protein
MLATCKARHQSDSEIDILMSFVDSDGNGELELGEFLYFLQVSRAPSASSRDLGMARHSRSASRRVPALSSFHLHLQLPDLKEEDCPRVVGSTSRSVAVTWQDGQMLNSMRKDIREWAFSDLKGKGRRSTVTNTPKAAGRTLPGSPATGRRGLEPSRALPAGPESPPKAKPTGSV